MYHQEYGHNAMVPGIFKEFASEIYAKIDERVSENTREMAKKLKDKGVPIDVIAGSSVTLAIGHLETIDLLL